MTDAAAACQAVDLEGPVGTHAIPGVFRAATTRFRDATWMRYDGVSQSFAELAQRVDSIAAGLLGAGTAPGGGVASYMGNCLEWLQVEYAAIQTGNWFLPLNTWLRSRELSDIMVQAPFETLFWSGEVLGRDTVDLLRALVPELDDARPGHWRSARFPSLRRVVGIGPGPWPPGVLAWSDLIRSGDGVAGSEVRARADAVEPDDTALIIFTSGTTGTPKGAMLANTAIVDHMAEWTRHLGLGAADCSVMGSPLFWIFGCTMNAMVPLLAGSSIVLKDRFQAAAFLADIESLRATHLQGVPEQYEMLLDQADQGEHDLSSLKVIQIGGSKTTSSLADRLARHAPEGRMVTAYGLSEAVSVNAWTEFGDPLEKLVSTVGHPAPDNEISIRDPETWDEVPAGSVGEIWIRGRHLMKGYIGALEATAETLVDGYLRTGDLASYDDDGYLVIAGRRSHTYKRGSMNVYPAEAESRLLEHPAVEQVAVIGVPDERLGQVGAAFIVCKPDFAITGDDLLAWLSGRLAAYKVPTAVKFVDDLPRTASGKVRKFELESAWQLGTGDDD